MVACIPKENFYSVLFIEEKKNMILLLNFLLPYPFFFCFREDPYIEKIDLDESTVNPPNTRLGPENFQLLKVLGKGGYGKV